MYICCRRPINESTTHSTNINAVLSNSVISLVDLLRFKLTYKFSLEPRSTVVFFHKKQQDDWDDLIIYSYSHAESRFA